ncbi:MAG: ABC transporter ATP-binding protein [Acidobacteriota bacterium]
MAPLLSARHLSVAFGGVKAVDDVSFDIEEGEVLSVIGPNGAGKTTLLNVISRLYDPEPGGELFFAGRDFTRLPAHRVAHLGIARTFQNIELFEHETVLRNLLIGLHAHRTTSLLAEMLFLPSAVRQELEFRRRAEAVIDLLDLQAHREHAIAGLPYGVRKLVEVGRALCLGPKLLLLDEPSSGLNPEETEDVAYWIEDVNEDFGATILMVEHDMGLVGEVSDRVLVLADGAVLTTGSVDEVRAHPEVARAYLGDGGPVDGGAST